MMQDETWWLCLSLAVVAALGYFVGRRQRRLKAEERTDGRHEVLRAIAVAQELDAIGQRLRAALTTHVRATSMFRRRLNRLDHSPDASWHDLCDRADEFLKPTLRLGSEISHSYAELLRQMTHLSSFAEMRADPLTGVSNRRAFDESIEMLLAEQARYPSAFSLAMLDIDCFKQINDEHGHLQGDRVLQEFAQLLKTTVRDCDILARYGGEEFAILMPRTELHAACNLAQRIRAAVEKDTPITVSFGLASFVQGDTAASLVARADAALYSAKSGGRNCVFIHEGPARPIVGIKTPTSPDTTPKDASPRATEPGPTHPSDVLPALASSDLEAAAVPALPSGIC